MIFQHKRNRVFVVGIRSYLWEAKNKPGFWGFLGVAVGAKKPGFCCGYHQLFVGSEKETRFLGVAVGVKKPGFCCGYQELFVGSEKETRFLGVSGCFWGGCWEKETGFLL